LFTARQIEGKEAGGEGGECLVHSGKKYLFTVNANIDVKKKGKEKKRPKKEQSVEK